MTIVKTPRTFYKLRLPHPRSPLPGINFCSFSPGMETEEWDSAAIQMALLKLEILQRLKRAIDYRQQRLLESARDEWDRRFAGQDPSNGCVSVRITSEVIKTPGLNWGYQLPGQSHLTIAPPNATPPEVTC